MGEKLNFKDIAVTPLIIDHSAYDAYMFLIETDNKKVLYTGDFRTHGTRGKAFIPTLLKYVGQVDVLITEGTMLTRAETQITEKKLLDKAKKYLRDFKYVFLICSSTNIDRIGSFHQATPKGKYFICDKYQYDVLLSVRKYAGHLTSLYQYKKALY